MPRARPRLGWKKPAPLDIELTEKQRSRLARVRGLPAKVLPAVEDIARLAIAQQRNSNFPKPTETRAAMAGLHKKISAARAAISKCDEWTKNRIELAHWRVVGSTEDQLAKFEAALDAAEAALEGKVTPQLAAANRKRYVASQLRHAFEIFGVRFDRTKRSPAKETLSVILSFATPTGVDAADHYVRWAEKFGD